MTQGTPTSALSPEQRAASLLYVESLRNRPDAAPRAPDATPPRSSHGLTVEEIAKRTHGRRSGSQYVGHCPGHNDRHESLSISTGDDGRILLKCHAGCEVETIVTALGLSMSDLFPSKDRIPPQPKPATIFYDYPDARGHVLFQVARFPDKQFRQRRPNGHGGWVWNLNGVKRVLYHLPDVRKADLVCIAEGEKDCETLLARHLERYPMFQGRTVAATTNSGGADNWEPSYGEFFKGKDVLVFEDNDVAGRNHALDVLRSVHPHAKSVKLISLPGLPEKGDVSDWMQDHSVNDLLEEIERAPVWFPEPVATAQVFSADTPAPKPAVPLLSPDEAAALTAELLETCRKWITRYVVVSKEQSIILAVWLLHTYVMDACDWTPYLHITGPEKSVGKTLLEDVLAALACNPRIGSGMTPAALVRIVDKYHPSLFLDEIDTITNGNKEMGEAIRGILDAGFKRGGVFLKCDGKDNEVREFKVFGAKCFAGLGALADTIESRSIPIEMRRKLRSERVERYRGRVVAQLATPIKAKLEQWGPGVTAHLKSIVPAPIDALSDRANDVTEILLAIAQLAGGDWLQRLTAALLAVYQSAVAADTSTGIVLLGDVLTIFNVKSGQKVIPSKELVSDLCLIEGRPWIDWSRGRGLSPNTLARLLAKYHIYPGSIREGEDTSKGYKRESFKEAWERYCGYSDFSTVTTTQPASLLAETPFSNRHTENDVTFQKCPQPRMDIEVCRCDVSKPDMPTQEGIPDSPPKSEEAEPNFAPEEQEEEWRL